MTPELLAACDEIEGLAAIERETFGADTNGIRRRLDAAVRRALDLGLLAAARRGVEEMTRCRLCELSLSSCERGLESRGEACCYGHWHGEFAERKAEEGETR